MKLPEDLDEDDAETSMVCAQTRTIYFFDFNDSVWCKAWFRASTNCCRSGPRYFSANPNAPRIRSWACTTSSLPPIFATVDAICRCRATRLDSAASRSWIAAIHEELIPFEEVARTLSLMRGSVSDFRRWLNASNAELNYRAPLQMIRAGQIHELAGIVRSALLGQPD